MNRNASMTLVATLFLLLVVSVLAIQMQIFQSERLQKQIMIDEYHRKINRLNN